MAGIVGINKPDSIKLVEKMLYKISYRGNSFKKIFTTQNCTFGIVANSLQSISHELTTLESVRDYFGDEHLAQAKEFNDTLELKRDLAGVAPLYYGFTGDNKLCFASEIKSLLEVTKDINELMPGNIFRDGQSIKYDDIKKPETYFDSKPEKIASDLYQFLNENVKKRIYNDEVGCWLSGGIDSSVFSALVKEHVKKLHTFSAGLRDSKDLEYSRIMSKHLNSIHHEVVVTLDEMIAVLPQVIYHLESFDAYLVRSSIMNYLVSREASNHVEHIFSGEGGDELFGGYDYLKNLSINNLEDELIDITKRLHNTALQRVDRCASAFGTVASVVFTSPQIIDFALKIPVEYKIYNGIEKWILRLSMKDKLPEQIFKRTKAKFWEGSGVEELLSEYAEERISDLEFNKEKKLKNGWVLNSKEELLYYRIFKEHFGEFENLDWMGRTKSTPN